MTPIPVDLGIHVHPNQLASELKGSYEGLSGCARSSGQGLSGFLMTSLFTS